MKALVIEDDPIIAFHLKGILFKLNFNNVEIVDEIEPVLKFIGTEHFDFIISNLKLRDGWVDPSFFLQLTKTYNNILIITGLSNNRLHNINIKKIQTLYKPFTTHQVENMVQNNFSF